MVRADEDVLRHRHGREQGDVLERPPDAEPGMRCLVAGDAPGREQDLAGVGSIDAADAVEQCRLAGPVRPDQAADSRSAPLERDAVQCDHAAEAAPRRHGRSAAGRRASCSVNRTSSGRQPPSRGSAMAHDDRRRRPLRSRTKRAAALRRGLGRAGIGMLVSPMLFKQGMRHCRAGVALITTGAPGARAAGRP